MHRNPRTNLARAALVVTMLSVTATAVASRTDFGRFAIILERQPFGSPPPVVVAPPAPTPVQPATPGKDAFINALRMCAITENSAGTRVGLIDIRSKPQKSYFLYVGDQEDGIELVEADYLAEKALLRKGAEQYWISMGSASATGTGTSGGSTGATLASVSPRENQPTKRMSYAERLRQRRDAESLSIKRLQERPKLTTEELEVKLKEYQMEVIRKGQPPLPIPLTQEMDDQLVAEGVLPPQ